MGFTKSTDDLKVHQSLGDTPNIDNGLSPEDLKKKFDEPVEKLQESFNKLIDELEKEVEGFEASKTLTASKLYTTDTSGNTIHDKLVTLKNMIDSTVLGNIPDNSISKEKLESEFADSIPTNNQMGVLYLASKYIEVENSGITKTTYSSPSLTNTNHTGYNLNVEYKNYPYDGVNEPTDIYTMIGGNGENGIGAYSKEVINLILELPKFLKIATVSMSVDGDIGTIGKLYGSVDGIEYELIKDYSTVYGSKTKITIEGNSKYYKFIKIFQDSHSNDRGTHLYNNIVIHGEVLENIDNTNILKITTTGNAKLNSYEKGQIIKLFTPDTYVCGTNLNATLNINSLGTKLLPDNLEPNKKYSLIYDGEKFIHENEENN